MFVLLGCSARPMETSNSCSPGATQQCYCPGTYIRGAQSCNSSGVGWGACACSDAGTAPADVITTPTSPLVAISIRSAVIGIAQFPTNEEWDSSSQVAPGLLRTLGDIIGAVPHPYAQVAGQLLSFLSGADFSHYDKPDPVGTTSIFAGGRWQIEQALSTESNNTENTFTPGWRGADGRNNVGWVHVRLTDDVRVRLVVEDEDNFKNDPIGDVEISASELRAALEAGTVYFTSTASQSHNQLLFVGISVARE